VSDSEREATTMKRPFLQILYEVLFVSQELASVLTRRALALKVTDEFNTHRIIVEVLNTVSPSNT
jgi:hypothetical protein